MDFNEINGIKEADKDEIEEIENIQDESDKAFDITNPFNTKDIKITAKTISLDNIIKRLRHDEIDLNPDFQRNSGLWDNSKMSRLIESIILRLPLPIFYFDVSDNNRWIVIDGLQRLTTIKNFVVEEKLKLTGLEFLKELQGKKFKDLDRSIQRTIEESEIVTYQVEPQTPKEVRYSVFNRINTGGISLNLQEIRQALNQKNNGVNLLKEVAGTDSFKKIVNTTSKRMVDNELVLRFIAFKRYNYIKFQENTKTLPRLLDETMETVDTKEYEENEHEKLKKSLLKALEILERIFDKESLFNKKLVDEKKTRTLNKSLFETWTVLVSNLTEKEQEKLVYEKEKLIEKYKELLNKKEFDDSITKGTNDRKAIVTRFSLLENLIRGILDDKETEIS